MTPGKKKFVAYKYEGDYDAWRVRRPEGYRCAEFYGNDARQQARAHAKRLNEMEKGEE